jgi:hypothetical protein
MTSRDLYRFCKSMAIRIHLLLYYYRTSVETLLEMGFQPTRTVVLAFGADEERGGKTVSTQSRPLKRCMV